MVSLQTSELQKQNNICIHTQTSNIYITSPHHYLCVLAKVPPGGGQDIDSEKGVLCMIRGEELGACPEGVPHPARKGLEGNKSGMVERVQAVLGKLRHVFSF
jgi:hypothetical protein